MKTNRKWILAGFLLAVVTLIGLAMPVEKVPSVAFAFAFFQVLGASLILLVRFVDRRMALAGGRIGPEAPAFARGILAAYGAAVVVVGGVLAL